MNELQLKYGCNPNQKPSRVYMEDGSELPITVLNGRPGYINLLDALNGYQLVKELKKATGKPAATSLPRRRSHRPSPHRSREKDLLGRGCRRTHSHGSSLCPCPRRRQNVQLW